MVSISCQTDRDRLELWHLSTVTRGPRTLRNLIAAQTDGYLLSRISFKIHSHTRALFNSRVCSLLSTCGLYFPNLPRGYRTPRLLAGILAILNVNLKFH